MWKCNIFYIHFFYLTFHVCSKVRLVSLRTCAAIRVSSSEVMSWKIPGKTRKSEFRLELLFTFCWYFAGPRLFTYLQYRQIANPRQYKKSSIAVFTAVSIIRKCDEAIVLQSAMDVNSGPVCLMLCHTSLAREQIREVTWLSEVGANARPWDGRSWRSVCGWHLCPVRHWLRFRGHVHHKGGLARFVGK